MNSDFLYRSFCGLLILQGLLRAGEIDFETRPDGRRPRDNTTLDAPYSVDGIVVRFGFDITNDGVIDSAPFFERQSHADAAPHGFLAGTTAPRQDRVLATDGSMGRYFLRGGGLNQQDDVPGRFIIEFLTPNVTYLEGEIWDVDGTSTADAEQWDLRVFDSEGKLVQTHSTGLRTGQRFDGRPYDFSFGDLTTGVQRVEFEFTGTRNLVDVGLAFDNFEFERTYVGDANFVGEFNSSDLVEVFQAGKFEMDVDANWSEGDWNADQRFDSGDFVAAFQDGGFESGPRAVASVPEPMSSLFVYLLLGIHCARRRRWHRGTSCARFLHD